MADQPQQDQQAAPAEQTAETTPAQDLANHLASYPGAPNSQQIESWKQQYGDIYCSGFSDNELFIFRPLNRREYVSLQKELNTPPTQANQEPMNNFDFEEKVAKACLLWSSVNNLDSKGGTLSTLSEQVMQNSNFTNPQLAAALVVKL